MFASFICKIFRKNSTEEKLTLYILTFYLSRPKTSLNIVSAYLHAKGINRNKYKQHGKSINNTFRSKTNSRIIWCLTSIKCFQQFRCFCWWISHGLFAGTLCIHKKPRIVCGSMNVLFKDMRKFTEPTLFIAIPRKFTVNKHLYLTSVIVSTFVQLTFISIIICK